MLQRRKRITFADIEDKTRGKIARVGEWDGID